MKIKIIDAVNLFNLLEKMNNSRMPIKASYLLAKIKNNLESENKFYSEQLQNYINEYGEKDEKGQLCMSDHGITIQADKVKECNSKINELNSMDIEVEDIKISIEDLSKTDLTFEEVQILLPFISDEE